MNNLRILDFGINDLKVIERKKIEDARGSLSRLFCSNELNSAGWKNPIAQINFTYTKLKGTVRGMHFQNHPFAEDKLVTCIKGKIFDVAVDLRKDSKSFLKHESIILSKENNRSFLIPKGFAHGFQTLTDDVELIYFHSQYYTPQAESGINPNDQVLNIRWPEKITSISERDANHKNISNNFKGI